jgi:hypothetical protein
MPFIEVAAWASHGSESPSWPPVAGASRLELLENLLLVGSAEFHREDLPRQRLGDPPDRAGQEDAALASRQRQGQIAQRAHHVGAIFEQQRQILQQVEGLLRIREDPAQGLDRIRHPVDSAIPADEATGLRPDAHGPRLAEVRGGHLFQDAREPILLVAVDVHQRLSAGEGLPDAGRGAVQGSNSVLVERSNRAGNALPGPEQIWGNLPKHASFHPSPGPARPGHPAVPDAAFHRTPARIRHPVPDNIPAGPALARRPSGPQEPARAALSIPSRGRPLHCRRGQCGLPSSLVPAQGPWRVGRDVASAGAEDGIEHGRRRPVPGERPAVRRN